jgi:hypothetical protein
LGDKLHGSCCYYRLEHCIRLTRKWLTDFFVAAAPEVFFLPAPRISSSCQRVSVIVPRVSVHLSPGICYRAVWFCQPAYELLSFCLKLLSPPGFVSLKLLSPPGFVSLKVLSPGFVSLPQVSGSGRATRF